jgi:hypothetical protein
MIVLNSLRGKFSMNKTFAKVTGASSRPNTSTMSGRSNPNKPKADGGAQLAPKRNPVVPKPITKPNFHGKPVR